MPRGCSQRIRRAAKLTAPAVRLLLWARAPQDRGSSPAAVMRATSMMFRAIKKKLAKMAAKSFPLNAVRVRALRIAGYQVGDKVYVGEELHITDELVGESGSLSIGDRAAIGQRVLIILCSRPNDSRLRETIAPVIGSVRIGADAWVGAGTIILPNVMIGEAAIVGAGSIVTRDVPAGSVAVGNPARVIKKTSELHAQSIS